MGEQSGALFDSRRRKSGHRHQKRAFRYNNEFNKTAYDRINLTVPKGNKDKIKAHAEQNGESVNGFINRAVDETMERDKRGTSEK